MPEKRYISRFVLFSIIIAIILTLVIWRYITLMCTPHSDLAGGPSRPVRIERGPIMDRNGRILAIQTQLDSVTAWMPYVKNPDATASLLLSALDTDEEVLREKFRTSKGFFYIKQTVSKAESDAVRTLIEEGSISGISLVPEPKRIYPQGELASHLVGLSGKDNQGLMGIEYSLDSELYPQTERMDEPVSFGNQVYLSIDINIQYLLEKIAEKAFEEHNPDYVTIIAADARTGGVLAYVNIPSFNPNNFNISQPRARINHPAVTAYEPGSVFKIYSIAGIMEHGGVEPNSLFYCDGTYSHVDPPISCLRAHGWVTPADIIKVSCNAGASYASENISREEFYRMLVSFGFGIKTNAALPGETNGILNSISGWSPRSKPTIAFGQEISVSALQLVQAATVFTNRGDLLELHLIDRVVSPDGEIIRQYDRTPLRRVVSASTAQAMLLMMETATKTGGTATRATIEGIRVSAKTGTAQVPDPRTGSYSTTSYVSSTIAIFPTDNPAIILYASIHHPRGTQTYGAMIAAPIIREAGEQIVDYLGIQREGDIVLTHPGTVLLPVNQPITVGEKMPDLSGFSKRQLFPLIMEERLNVHIEGSGWVTGQDPPPGTVLREGMNITIILK